MSAPPAPFVPEQHRFKPGHALLVGGFGSSEEHAALVAPIRDAVTSLFELVTPMPFVALQQMFNDSKVPDGDTSFGGSRSIASVPQAIRKILKYLGLPTEPPRLAPARASPNPSDLPFEQAN